MQEQRAQIAICYFDTTDLLFKPVDPNNPLPVTGTFTSGAAPAALVGQNYTVDTTAGGIALAAASAGRLSLGFYNNGVNAVGLGPAGLTFANAPVILPPGGFFAVGAEDGSRLAWNGIATAGSSDVRVFGPV